MKRLRRHLGRLGFDRASDGAIAVEFGMIAPIILVMLLGVIEVSSALSQNLAVQQAARAGTDYGMTRPPLQGDMAPIVKAVKAAMPPEWVSAGTQGDPSINATLVCECEVSGPIACGNQCAANEKKQTYLKVDVSKNYTPIVTFRFFNSSFNFSNTSQVRLN